MQSASKRQVDTLVLTDSETTRSSHSSLFAELEHRGHQLRFKSFSDKLELQQFGEYMYDNLLIISVSGKELSLKSRSILSFVESGRGLLLAVNSNVHSQLRSIANECGIDFDPKSSAVGDHFSFVRGGSVASADHWLVTSTDVTSTEAFVGAAGTVNGPVIFRGIAHAIAVNNKMVTPLLKGSATAFSATKDDQSAEPWNLGSKTLLVSALQTPSNGRVLLSGSAELCSNEFFNMPVDAEGHRSGNRQFCLELTKWTFLEKSVVVAKNLVHNVVGSTAINPVQYRINDNIVSFQREGSMMQCWLTNKQTGLCY